ncbi:plasmid replication protein, CyRepA1 family [Yoonia sp. MH D7]
MGGPNRGLWKDYSSGEGGDLFDLIAIKLCGLANAAVNFPKTLDAAAGWVGISKDQPIDLSELQAQHKTRARQAAKAEAVQVAHRVSLITDLQAKAQPIKGSPVAVYLASRGIVSLPDTALAYLPAMSYPTIRGILHPHRAALCVWGIDENGKVSGGQRVLIMPDGSKAPENTHKASFGAIQGNPARFTARALGGPLCVAEGPESALSIWQATGFETWAVFGVSGFKGAPLPPDRKVILCPDQDAPDSPAGRQFAAAVKHHMAEGRDIWIAPAPEPEGSKRDLNDTLQRAGNAAVSNAIASALEARPQREQPTIYNVKLPKAAKLPDRRKETLLVAMRETTQDNALAVAVAVAQTMQFRAPVEHTSRSIAAIIKDHMGDRLSEAEISAIEGRVAWMQGQRRQAILARTTIDENTAKRHEMVTITGLDQIDLPALKGVVLIKAPIGAGKTQRVGRPFITASKTAGGGVMAIAHRTTLIDELAHRLVLPHYQNKSIQDEIEEVGGVAVCLPSITRHDIQRLMPAPRFVFIDEVAQVLQFLAEEKLCRSGGGTNYEVYGRLQEIVRLAETVVVTDAGLDMRTILFLEQCRPNERFKVIEMKATPSGKKAVVYAKGAVVLTEISIELVAGGKVWLACEGAKKAAALAASYAKRGYKVICISAETKFNTEQRAFLQNADAQSRLYDIVIASPAISSGLSIEHKGDPHFTLGAYIGAGTVTRPEDAKQQLGRVRYLTRFAIGLELLNFTGGQTVKATRKGSERAAEIEGLDVSWTGFDDYVAQIKVDAANARADFGAGLWFLLEADGWTLERPPIIDSRAAREEMRNITAEHKAARIADILNAAPMDSHQAMLIEGMARNTEQETRWLAHTMRLQLGKLDLTEQDVTFWDGGRGSEKLAHYVDLMQCETESFFESGFLTQRPFRIARRRLYATLFEGIDLIQPITSDIAEMIINRIMKQPEAYAAVEIVGPKYRASFRGNNDVSNHVKRPQKPSQELKDIFQRCGLAVSLQRKRTVPLGAVLLDKKGAKGTESLRGNVVTVTPDSYAYMAETLARRGTFDLDAELARAERQSASGN